MKGYLVLENGQIFEGEKIGSDKDTACEVVFNTGMAGYIETFTDPSYAGQGIVMTYPLIGNYGIIKQDSESSRIWAKAVIVHKLAEHESNFRTEGTLESFLIENDIPGLKNVNTRKLTKILRDSGTMKGYITTDITHLSKIHGEIEKYKISDVVEEVTCKEVEKYNENAEKQVALLDYGYKKNILKSLLKRNVGVTIYPATTTAEEILKSNPDGIMLSNGPGDPEDCTFQIENVKKLYDSDIPIFGICLGHQLMGLATGAKTAKLKYGHRGPNHPVKDLETRRVYITSQNHGYYILETSIDPEIAEVSHVNLNDRTVEGLKYKNKNIFTVQFHPEACPGPEDTGYLFDKFVEMI
ncbi:MAG: carbamoyl phosphate synthase small subunit [Clostridia bacterium]|nr:carbamoyl phosphate synthase small subunit [Clostridia bacterium]